MNRHISEQYELELAQIQDTLMEMGGIVERQVQNACMALVEHDLNLAESVMQDEIKTNQLELFLDDQCLSIIAKRQPAAGDLRRVVSVMKIITDLERIGDEAERVAKMAIALIGNDKPADQYAKFRELHTHVAQSLSNILDAFAREDVEAARNVIRFDRQIDAEYKALTQLCLDALAQPNAPVTHLTSVMWAARSLERIGDHAKNISEYIIFQVAGEDVRHHRATEPVKP